MQTLKLVSMMSVSVLSLVASPAWAQSPAPENDSAAVSEEERPTDNAIVVTARRREEAITDVPVSVVALSGDSLQARGIEAVEDLVTSTPGLSLSPTAGRASNAQYELRGIGTVESLITEDPAVGVYVDDVYRARATGTNQSLFDIANVQVLYGPQGTLFGRNSTAGAILINSNRPTDDFEGSIEVGVGNLDSQDATLVLNVPVSDTLQVRIAGNRKKMDGYATNASTGGRLGAKDRWAGRLSVNFEPTPSIRNLLVASIYDANDSGSPTVLIGTRTSTTPNEFGQVPALAGTPFAPLVDAVAAATRASGYRTTYLDAAGATIGLPNGAVVPLVGLTGFFQGGDGLTVLDPFEKVRTYSISNTTTIDLTDDIQIKNVFGYNRVNYEAATDLDGTPIKLIDTYYVSKNDQFSNEIQLLGDTGRLNWVIGGYYFHEKGSDFQPSIQFVALASTSRLVGVNQSIGLFAQGTYEIVDGLSLTVGGRYTWDKRKARFSEMLLAPLGGKLAVNGGFGIDPYATAVCGLAPSIDEGGCTVSRKKSFGEPSYTVSLDYKPSPDTLLYVAHRHGYRSGGFNARITLTAPAAQQLAQTAAFRPETIDDVEAGFKANFDLGGVELRAGFSGYYAWYKDIQKQTTQFVGGTGVTLITNAGTAKVKGFEANFGITPTRGFDIDAYVGYVDGRFADFPSPATPAFVAANPGSDFADVDFPGAKTTFGVTTSLTPYDGPNGVVTLVGNYSYRSSLYGANALPTLDPEARLPGQHNVNVSLGWEKIMGSDLSATAWVRNATNETNFYGAFNLVPTFGLGLATLAEPRTYGLTLKYAFGQ